MQDDRVVVIGAGVIGTMTARALAKRGRRVTLIERLPGAAELCSRGNAGMMAVGHAKAWAEPAALPALGQALLGLLRAHAPVSGAVMMLRVRRARSRAELRALLPDVQARLQRVRPQGETRELLLRVESLLVS